MPIVRISDLSWGGEGIGRIEGKVVFVPYSLPGEVVEVELVHSKKTYSRGKLIRLLDPSPYRIEPPCSFYQVCGGCQLQHLSPFSQVQEKERLFRQSLDHALKDKEILVKPTLISPMAFGYRHRLQLKSAWKKNRFFLGFFGPQSHEVVSINHCLLANGAINKVLASLQEIIQSLYYQEWDPEIELQLFGNLSKGGLVFSSPKGISPSQKKRITEELLSAFGYTYLLFQESNQLPFQVKGEHPFSKEKDSPDFTLPASETGLRQDILMTCFPRVFTQINLELNRRLIGELLSLNLFDSQDTILDLYCGLGNFSLPVSFKVQEVIGLEVFPLAVANARWNQRRNQIDNCTFIEAKVHEGIEQVRYQNKPITQVILDPPRTGAREVIPWVNAWNLRGILYISCNPMTLFRDLTQFIDEGWKVEWTQPVDFFPQTFHLESITYLSKN
jgi:23S rRNA (uracil1939-C5)-methyltransferase